jgi:hypothetical protein
LSILFVSSAAAQVQRTFVSGGGNDSNPCSRAAPCRTFAQAISKTVTGGEVIVLDSAGYGAFTITQAVSIIAPPGIYAGISVFSGDGITVNAGASDNVMLSGLTINNQGSNGNGVVFNTGGTLRMEELHINGFNSSMQTAGLAFLGPGNLEVRDCAMQCNGICILVQPSSGTPMAAIDFCKLEGSTAAGLSVQDGSQAAVRNSQASGNKTGTGFQAIAHAAGPVELNIENCLAFNNGDGIDSVSKGGTVTVRVSNSTVTNNTSFGLFQSGGAASLLLRGNNTVEGNGNSNTSGTIGSYNAK